MSTLGDKYILGSGRSDHDRLHVISEIHDDRTRELLMRDVTPMTQEATDGRPEMPGLEAGLSVWAMLSPIP